MPPLTGLNANNKELSSINISQLTGPLPIAVLYGTRHSLLITHYFY